MASGEIRVAVVGMGDVGRGWASLIVAAGWPVVIYDNDGVRLDEAPAEIEERARTLVEVSRADPTTVDAGLSRLEVGRSLLQACRDAQWIIEATQEDLRSKQKLFEALESVAHNARVVSSSETEHTASDVAAGVYRKDRCLVIHPISPPELIPLVELQPSPDTDRALLEVVKAWLRALGRIPITLKKPIKGSIVGRINAAVWREAISLVEDGVVDADELDRAVSLGPALAWASAGPLLATLLAADDANWASFFQRMLSTFAPIWEDLADWKQLEAEKQTRIIQSIQRAYKGQIGQIRPARDRRLAAILRALEEARHPQG